MKTSCTRSIGSPNNYSPIITVTYSVSSLCVFSVVMMRSSGCLVGVIAMLLERCDETLAVKFCDEIVEAGLADPCDRVRRGHGRQRDNGRGRCVLVSADRFRERKSVHAGHFEVGD